jgi:hypothetical protein
MSKKFNNPLDLAEVDISNSKDHGNTGRPLVTVSVLVHHRLEGELECHVVRMEKPLWRKEVVDVLRQLAKNVENGVDHEEKKTT